MSNLQDATQAKKVTFEIFLPDRMKTMRKLESGHTSINSLSLYPGEWLLLETVAMQLFIRRWWVREGFFLSVEISKFLYSFVRYGKVAPQIIAHFLFVSREWPIKAGIWATQNYHFHCHNISLRMCCHHLSIRQDTGSWSRYITCADTSAHHRAVQLLISCSFRYQCSSSLLFM